jgi:hypothetical protein
MQTSMPDLVAQFVRARRVSVPLLAITTPDPAATIGLVRTYGLRSPGSDQEDPVFSWDVSRGLLPVNSGADKALATLLGSAKSNVTMNPSETLKLLANVPPKSVVFFHNAHRFVRNEFVSQGIWNLRDLFKGKPATLVLLAPAIDVPAELFHDLLVLEETLPGREQLAAIIKDQCVQAQIETPAEDEMAQAVSALQGLAAFPAEQVVALSLSKRNGINLARLWERKRQMINATPGLSVWGGNERFHDIGGVQAAKDFLARLFKGNDSPKAVVFLDEIEKMFSGSLSSNQDSSGVTVSMLGTLLTYMQDHKARGIIFVGPPGTCKSMVAKASGTEAGVPAICFDLGAMKASLVGQSESQLRQALGVVSAVAENNVLFIATSNNVSALPPELLRRFKYGVMFFDLPSAAERETIWAIYRKQFQIPPDMIQPPDQGWTGDEIRTCCELSWQLGCSLEEASAYIIPVAIRAADQLKELRSQANYRYLSASYPGPYLMDKAEAAQGPSARMYAA